MLSPISLEFAIISGFGLGSAIFYAIIVRISSGRGYQLPFKIPHEDTVRIHFLGPKIASWSPLLLEKFALFQILERPLLAKSPSWWTPHFQWSPPLLLDGEVPILVKLALKLWWVKSIFNPCQHHLISLNPNFGYPLVTRNYWTWPSRNSWFTNYRRCFSIVFCMFSRGYPLASQFHVDPNPQCEAPKIAKLVYNSNSYGLWYL